MIDQGHKIGRYKILSAIGSGGMGEVFLAEDTHLPRKIALKVLPKKIASDFDRLRRFEQEAFAASALNHPNILTIYEFGVENDTHFLAAEFIAGETLRERMRRERLTLSEILEITIQIASALQAAHSAGIIHRDIKPENIMIREDGFVKVLDFGLAKLVEQTPLDVEAETIRQVRTQAGMIMGTTAYMSPEQARGEAVDIRTDIFSLGVVVYEMLTGKQPFTGETINHTIVAILEKAPPGLFHFVKDYPGAIETIVHKSLEKNTNQRYQSAQDLLVELKSLQKRCDFEIEIKHTLSSNDRIEADTQILKAKTDLGIVEQTGLLKTNSDGISSDKKSKFKWVFAAAGGALVLIGLILFALTNSKFSPVQQPGTNQNRGSDIVVVPSPRANKRYLEMSENEKQQFVSSEADKILQLIKSTPESEITPSGNAAIKYYVDDYAKRSKF